MIIRHKTLFQRNDHLNQENLEHSVKTYIKMLGMVTVFGFRWTFTILFTYFGQSVSKFCAR